LKKIYYYYLIRSIDLKLKIIIIIIFVVVVNIIIIIIIISINKFEKQILLLLNKNHKFDSKRIKTIKTESCKFNIIINITNIFFFYCGLRGIYKINGKFVD
jgi:hypothetical protein